MDRRGSGLSDIVTMTANNNSAVAFGPIDENQRFIITMQARPEAIDEITNTALPLTEETVRFSSNLVPIEEMPSVVWHVGTSASSNRSFYKAAEGLAAPPGHVSGGRFYSFYDLEALSEAMVAPYDSGDIETLQLEELLEIPGGESIVVKLLHDQLFEHMRVIGFQIEYDRRRAYFARGEDPELKVSYQARVRKATRTVVKARTKRDSDDIVYYEHKAVSFSAMRFGQGWAVVLTPGYAFTRDGVNKPIARERTNILSTRRAARDFNSNVLQDVAFWLAVLSREAEGLFALELRQDNDLSRFAPTILLSHRLPTLSVNVSAFDDGHSRDREIDEDLADLDFELEALALQPEGYSENLADETGGGSDDD